MLTPFDPSLLNLSSVESCLDSKVFNPAHTLLQVKNFFITPKNPQNYQLDELQQR